jgi:Holliday junction resolvase-like predicted endonuclease
VTELVIVAVVAAVAALWLAGWVRRWRGSVRARRRADRANAGEEDAVEMLEKAGYQIVERQARIAWIPLVDGEPFELELRADYLVEIDGELFVAEVKTGEEATSITTAATRRQLLEYSIAFEVDGVLLVCPERDAIHRVEFGFAKTRS